MAKVELKAPIIEEIKETSCSNEITKITLPLKCNNENEITSVRIKCHVVKGKTKIPVEGFVDTWCTMLIIKRELVPEELIVMAKEPMNARQIDGSFITYA